MIVVLFSATVREEARAEHDETDDRLYDVVSAMPGFVSYKSYTSEDGEEIGLIRFADRAALEAWRTHPDHIAAQRRGREHFYASYDIEVLERIRGSVFERDTPSDGVSTGD